MLEELWVGIVIKYSFISINTQKTISAKKDGL